MNKLTVAVLFGGVSSEHEVSCMSAQNVIHTLLKKPDQYRVFPIYISKEGKWFFYQGALEEVAKAPQMNYDQTVIVAPGGKQEAFFVVSKDTMENPWVDVVIPMLHGLNGEDGTVQGLLEMARIPYTGCGVLASSVGMDKVYTKKIVSELGIRQAGSFSFSRYDLDKNEKACVDAVEKSFDYPVFVKPSRAGSSVGAAKAENSEELKEAFRLAAQEDRLILVEEYIKGHEVECAVLGDGKRVITSEVGEIFAADEFYSYDAKYSNAESKTVIPASIDKEKRELIRQDAEKIFRAIDGEGLSRVDFFLEYETGEVVFNEINTCPGFTNISMWPMLMRDCGVSDDAQIDTLIQIAMERKPLYGA